MSDMEARNQRLDAAWMQSMMSDFEVKLRPEQQTQADFRLRARLNMLLSSSAAYV